MEVHFLYRHPISSKSLYCSLSFLLSVFHPAVDEGLIGAKHIAENVFGRLDQYGFELLQWAVLIFI